MYSYDRLPLELTNLKNLTENGQGSDDHMILKKADISDCSLLTWLVRIVGFDK